MDAVEHDGVYTATMSTAHMDGNGYYNFKVCNIM